VISYALNGAGFLITRHDPLHEPTAMGTPRLAGCGLIPAEPERYRSITHTVLAGALVRLALDPAAPNQTVESEDLR